jgi:hypothetical protein
VFEGEDFIDVEGTRKLFDWTRTIHGRRAIEQHAPRENQVSRLVLNSQTRVNKLLKQFKGKENMIDNRTSASTRPVLGWRRDKRELFDPPFRERKSMKIEVCKHTQHVRASHIRFIAHGREL